MRQGTTWSQQAYLKASNTDEGDWFGCSVAVSGDTVVVGAQWEDSGGTGVDGAGADAGRGASGAAYVFVRSGATWTQQVSLKASNTGGGDLFGAGVAISEGVIVVGAPGEAGGAPGLDGDEADDSVASAGATYVFVRTGTTWSQATYAKAPTPGLKDELGCCVAASGDTVAALGGVINNGLAIFR